MSSAGPAPGQGPVVRLEGVSVVRDGRPILDGVDWWVGAGERWVVLGPNGSGKTTMLQVAGARLWPSAGVVEVLGARLGHVDVRTLRPRIALVSGSVARQLRPDLTVRDVVVTGRYGALEPWWNEYTNEDYARAQALLTEAGVAAIAERTFAVVSEGERQQALLARALMSSPELLLLDEPAAGLDLGARERLVLRLGTLADDPHVPPVVLVTHHTEEIPPGFTHAALVRGGQVLAAGPLESVLTADAVSACFGVRVQVGRDGARWWSRATP
ncbi:MAG: ABC transporter ATP-binding protein [Acidimicrobiales bacterium]